MAKFFYACIASALVSVASATHGPNIVWIIADDMGADMGCYGDTYSTTHNLDRFASQGTRYTHAFSVHGQCSPSRSALITGMYPTTIGTQHMRCEGVPPAYVKCFTEYLRRAGYFCTNNAKTDYNFGWNGSKSPADWTSKAPLGAWDECGPKAHWRDRPDNATPFFSVFTLGVTHESQIFASDERAKVRTRDLSPQQFHDPAVAPLPPYYPDHQQVRHDVARYYDLVTAMDIQAGRLLAELEEDGLADNTVVFFFADNGCGLPRAKRWVYDSGIHVPLIVRWPGTLAAGAVQDRLVSFIDFAPTVLSIAGVTIPPHIQGRPFLGRDEGAPREYIFAARDRYDEVVDYMRTVRDHHYKYIRNFRPEIPYAVEVAYMDQMPMMRTWRELNAAGELEGTAKAWFAPRRPDEELYDTQTDPYEIINLANSPEQAQALERMRAALAEWQRETADLGGRDETELWEDRRPGGVWAETAPPVASPGGGAIASGATVTLKSATEGATIVYTMDDGVAPRWRIYSGPITFDTSCTLRAQAGRIGYKDSGIVSMSYTTLR